MCTRTQVRDWFTVKNFMDAQPITGSGEALGFQPLFQKPRCYYGGQCNVNGFSDAYLIGNVM